MYYYPRPGTISDANHVIGSADRKRQGKHANCEGEGNVWDCRGWRHFHSMCPWGNNGRDNQHIAWQFDAGTAGDWRRN
jgi:hypothetical protein